MRGEGYAYIWDKRKLKKSAAQSILADETEMFEPRILNSLSNDVNADCSIFARTPYYLRLEPRYGGFFELRFLNIHIYYGSASDVQKRQAEYDLLMREIYPRISQRRYGNFRPAFTIAMGDYMPMPQSRKNGNWSEASLNNSMVCRKLCSVPHGIWQRNMNFRMNIA